MTLESPLLSESIALCEEAKKLIRILRREIARNYPPPPDTLGFLSTMEDFLGDAERGGMAWKFKTECVPLKEVDRRKSIVMGPFFITDKYPLPTTKEGNFLLPCIQADLRALSKLRGLPLGSGLLQVFYAFPNGICRVIPRSVVNKHEPLPFPTEIQLFDTSIQVFIEDWMKDPEGNITVITGYDQPHIHYDTRAEPSMWEDMVAERIDRMGVDVSADEELEATVVEFKNEMSDEDLEESAPPGGLHAAGRNRRVARRHLPFRRPSLRFIPRYPLSAKRNRCRLPVCFRRRILLL